MYNKTEGGRAQELPDNEVDRLSPEQLEPEEEERQPEAGPSGADDALNRVRIFTKKLVLLIIIFVVLEISIDRFLIIPDQENNIWRILFKFTNGVANAGIVVAYVNIGLFFLIRSYDTSLDGGGDSDVITKIEVIETSDMVSKQNPFNALLVDIKKKNKKIKTFVHEFTSYSELLKKSNISVVPLTDEKLKYLKNLKSPEDLKKINDKLIEESKYKQPEGIVGGKTKKHKRARKQKKGKSRRVKKYLS